MMKIVFLFLVGKRNKTQIWQSEKERRYIAAARIITYTQAKETLKYTVPRFPEQVVFCPFPLFLSRGNGGIVRNTTPETSLEGIRERFLKITRVNNNFFIPRQVDIIPVTRQSKKKI
jgi:hypothetical protein